VRVAYIVSVGKGMESFIYREIEEVIRRGVEVFLYTTKYKDNDVYSPKKEWVVRRVNPFRLVISLLLFFLKSPRSLFKIGFEAILDGAFIEFLLAVDYSRLMKKDQINQIHCHFGDRKYFLAQYCKRLDSFNLSLTVHAHELFANPNEKLFKKALVYADKVVAISEKNRNILINDFGVNPDKVRTIRLSVDLENFKVRESVKVLTVARYTERKGFRELCQAIRILKEKKEALEFITVGFGDLDVKQMAKDYGVDDYVTVFNKMDPKQLRFFYNNCDVFCLPSKTTEEEGAEGIPVVLMEAMASEMIVVTTDNGSIKELVDSFVVEEGNPESLAEGLIYARDALSLGGIMGEKNREKVLLEYSDKNIDELKEYLYG